MWRLRRNSAYPAASPMGLRVSGFWRGIRMLVGMTAGRVGELAGRQRGRHLSTPYMLKGYADTLTDAKRGRALFQRRRI